MALLVQAMDSVREFRDTVLLRTPRKKSTNTLFFGVAIAVASSCADRLPEPPDTSEIVSDYESPSTQVNPGDADELGPVFETVKELYKILGEEDVFSAGSINAADEEDPNSGESGLDRFEVEGKGFLRITHVCPGWPSDAIRSHATTGSVETTVRFDRLGLGSVFWGVADQCKVSAGGSEVRLNGELTVARYGTGAKRAQSL